VGWAPASVRYNPQHSRVLLIPNRDGRAVGFHLEGRSAIEALLDGHVCGGWRCRTVLTTYILGAVVRGSVPKRWHVDLHGIPAEVRVVVPQWLKPSFFFSIESQG
jgi:hypothetical protein